MSKRTRPPTDRAGETHRIDVHPVTLYVTLNRMPDGRPIEMFIKANEGYQGVCDTLAVTASIALQHGAPLETILAKWRGQRYEPSQVGRGTSIPDAIARVLLGETKDNQQETQE